MPEGPGGCDAMYEDTTWRVAALCRGDDAVFFFAPSHLERKEERGIRETNARALCARCPVRDECLEFALSSGEPHGIWGGLNELQRHRLSRRRGAGAA